MRGYKNLNKVRNNLKSLWEVMKILKNDTRAEANKNLYARLRKFKIFMRDYENLKFLCEIMKIETRAETT